MRRRRQAAFSGEGTGLAETLSGGVVVRLKDAPVFAADETPRRVIVLAVPEVGRSELSAELRALARLLEGGTRG